MKVRVQVDGQTYEVEIGDLSSRPIQALVDGELFAVWPEEIAGVVEVPLDEGGAPLPASASISAAARAGDVEDGDVLAPLPGDIIAVAVRAGDRVEAGQLLCTVESMKMNNPVRSPRAGTVGEVYVAVGDHVTYGQPMIRLR